MKKISQFLAIALLVGGMIACTGKEDNPPAAPVVDETATAPATAPTETTSDATTVTTETTSTTETSATTETTATDTTATK